MNTTQVEFEAHKASLSAFQTGFTDGRAASIRKERLTPYLRIGLDEYAQGYRSGFYCRSHGAVSEPDQSLIAGRKRTQAAR